MTFEKVKETILASLNCKEEKVVAEARLIEDLEMDSLDAADLAMALEEAFDITIADEEFEHLVTVKDIVDYIDTHK
ncbi:acyl carrier protein [Filifactor villosus]|uniref:Acyl carrier protein n=1 Tax=Filifactor villosus TaxID=29374 RepID=A0ABV9QPG4_9FIRM